MTDTIADPFGTTEIDSDPFATPEDVKPGTGSFKPSPTPEYLDGALIALVPRKHEEKAKKLERFVKEGEDPYQERWTVDLFVLDGSKPGADLSFWYKRKPENGEGAPEDVEYVIAAANMPEMFPSVWINQYALIGQINKVCDTSRPILAGRMRRGPRAAEARKGKTFADIAAEFAAWEKRNRRGEAPAFSWQVDTALGEADLTKLRAWYASATAAGDVDLTKGYVKA